MGADEPGVDYTIRIVDPHDDPILVTGNIEHYPTVPQNAGRPNVSLHVCGAGPVGYFDLPNPGHQRIMRIAITLASRKKRLERADGDDPHCKVIA
jgi:hypothetical protein